MTEILIEVLLGVAIFSYTGYVVYKKVKDLKAGKTCCGGCSSCSNCSIKENCDKK